MLPPPPPPPPPLPPSLISPEINGRHSLSYSPSLLVIAGLLVFAVLAIASIHLLLRYLSRSRHSPSPSSIPPFLHRLSSSSSSTATSNNNQQEPKDVIDSLPLFTLPAAAAASSSSLDCAVCLSPFEPRDQLRLLPSCRHAFHSHCIDAWLRSTLSCPLCRSSVHPPPPAAAAIPESESFRVEIGSVSRRTAISADENPPPPPPPPPPPHVRTYSLGSSFEYLVGEEGEEVEAVLSRIRRPEKSAPPYPPGDAVAEMAGGGGSRNWLSDYVDRLVSSASSSFSSLRWSRRFDSGGGGGEAAAGGENLDLERNLHLHLEEDDDGGFSSFSRWLLGA